jgi:hypothetical protein
MCVQISQALHGRIPIGGVPWRNHWAKMRQIGTYFAATGSCARTRTWGDEQLGDEQLGDEQLFTFPVVARARERM